MTLGPNLLTYLEVWLFSLRQIHGVPVARILYIFIGCVLAFTAAAKLYMLLSDPFAALTSGVPVPLLWIAVTAELAVFAAIIFAKSEFRWLFTFAVFALFTVASLTATLVGKRTCGCAGAILIPPQYFLLLDVSILILMWRIKPAFSSQFFTETVAYAKRHLGVLFGTLTILTAFLLIQSRTYGPAISRFLYETHVAAENIELGDVRLGTSTRFSVAVENRTDEAHVVVGMKPSCTCVSLEERRRVILEPNSTSEIPFHLDASSPGPLHQRVLLFLDFDRQHQVAVDVFASVKEMTQ